MTNAELSALCVCLVFFSLGGLAGSLYVMMHLLSSDHLRLPWRVKLRFYHFFGAEEILIRRAKQLDRDAREVFATIVIMVSADWGGPGPWPGSKQAMDNVLAEAERRFQLRISKTGNDLFSS